MTSSEITEVQIEDWKSKHGTVMLFEVGGKKGYFRTPKLKEMEAFEAQKTSVKFQQSLAKTCWLGGDNELLENDEYFIALMPKLDVLLKSFDVEVKKL